MYYFSHKFSKTANSVGGSPPPAALNL